MAGVKFSDLKRSHQELSKQQKDIFYVSNRVELQKILQIIPKKNLGLDFCNDKGVREQLKKTFEELCQKTKWYTNKSNVILIQGTLQDLKTTIKNIKQLKVIITFSTDRRELKTKFANNFLKYIIDVLRYEKQKIEEIEVDDTQIKKSSWQGYANPPVNFLNFGESKVFPKNFILSIISFGIPFPLSLWGFIIFSGDLDLERESSLSFRNTVKLNFLLKKPGKLVK